MSQTGNFSYIVHLIIDIAGHTTEPYESAKISSAAFTLYRLQAKSQANCDYLLSTFNKMNHYRFVWVIQIIKKKIGVVSQNQVTYIPHQSFIYCWHCTFVSHVTRQLRTHTPHRIINCNIQLSVQRTFSNSVGPRFSLNKNLTSKYYDRER